MKPFIRPTESNRVTVQPVVPQQLREHTIYGTQPFSLATEQVVILQQHIGFDALALRYLVIQAAEKVRLSINSDSLRFLLNFSLGAPLLVEADSGLRNSYKSNHYQLLYLPAGHREIMFPPGLYRFLQLEISTSYIGKLIPDPLFYKRELLPDSSNVPRHYGDLSLPISIQAWGEINRILSNDDDSPIGQLNLDSAAKHLLTITISELKAYEEQEIPIRRQERERFEDIRSYILSSLDQQISSKQLCQRFNLSHSWLYIGFKQMYKMNVQEYIRVQRIERGKELIRKGISVKEVAFSVGYKDVSSFMRVFKKVAGETPAAFRKQPK